MEFVSKINPKNLGYGVTATLDLLKTEGEDHVHLYTVFGDITDKESETSKFGIWVKFKGTFEAITEDGRTIRSAELFLPSVVTDIVLSAFEAGKKKGNDLMEIAFAVGARDIGEGSIIHTAETLEDIKVEDSLASRRKKFLPKPTTKKKAVAT